MAEILEPPGPVPLTFAYLRGTRARRVSPYRLIQAAPRAVPKIGLGERNLTSENRPMVETSGGRLHLQGQRRSVAAFLAANKTLLAAVWVVGFTLVFLWQSSSISVGGGGGGGVGFLRLRSALPPSRPAPLLRPKAYNLTDFGGVGDGRAVNTEAFERAVEAIAALADRGGGQLNVPPGLWLTAPFNLTSHMTLFLAEGAEILGITDEKYWPLMPALPSYGYGSGSYKVT